MNSLDRIVYTIACIAVSIVFFTGNYDWPIRLILGTYWAVCAGRTAVYGRISLDTNNSK